MWLFYGKNLVPLFKLLWGGCVLLFGGSYDKIIAMVWLNHALKVMLLGQLMRTCGLSWTAVLFAQVVFGLTPATIETLAFSVEWSVVLSTTFMLLALDGVFRPPFRWTSVAWAAASALSFVKSVLTGPLLALASLWAEGDGPRERLPRRFSHSAMYVLPSAIVGLLVAELAQGNHRHMGVMGRRQPCMPFGIFASTPPMASSR
jgi:hypothetical protein